MSAKLITYDLCAPGRDYTSLIVRLQQYPNACRICESSWIVSSFWTPAQIRNDLMKYIDSNDRIFVVSLTIEAAWYNTLASDAAVKLSLT